MKLNHKEFRVGNLVEYDGRVFEIDSVSEVLPTLNTIEFGIGVVDWNNLKPIPLNEDWLVRFGFEIGNYVYKDGFSLIILDTNFYLRPCYLGGYYWGFNMNGDKTDCELNDARPIKHVHNLQNLIFALTGTELTLTDK